MWINMSSCVLHIVLFSHFFRAGSKEHNILIVDIFVHRRNESWESGCLGLFTSNTHSFIHLLDATYQGMLLQCEVTHLAQWQQCLTVCDPRWQERWAWEGVGGGWGSEMGSRERVIVLWLIGLTTCMNSNQSNGVWLHRLKSPLGNCTSHHQKLGLDWNISRVRDQNGVSLLCIMLEIHHYGWEPSKYLHILIRKHVNFPASVQWGAFLMPFLSLVHVLCDEFSVTMKFKQGTREKYDVLLLAKPPLDILEVLKDWKCRPFLIGRRDRLK